jgi:Tol biopolymer transport system component
MIRRSIVIAIAAVLAFGLHVRAQAAVQAERLLAAAQHKATVDGDLKGAIEEYRKVFDAAKTNRSLAAEALLAMAECYQKLGDSEAQTIYQRVVREFSDQQEWSTIARARLGGGDNGLRATGDRAVWSGPGIVDGFGTVSPDGRYLTYTDWGAGAALMLHDMLTGSDRLLAGGPDAHGASQYSTISRDGKQVAYEWWNEQRYELRVANLQRTGTVESRRLVASEDVTAIAPFDWSPDGKWIAVSIARTDRTQQIGLVGTMDGSVRALKSVDWKGPTRISFSPDGRYIAYDLRADDNTNDRHVFVMATDGSRETVAVNDASQNTVMGWSPDGKYLLFASDRSGSAGLWIIPISDGKPQAAPALVKRDIGTFWSNGVTASGTMYVWREASPTYVQVATIDLVGGKLVPASTPIFQRFIASRGRPAWSADGKSLAFSSCGELGGGSCTLFIRSMETGQLRELKPALAYFNFLRWSPTGRTLMSPGTDFKGRQAVFSIDAQSGAVSALVSRDEVDKSIANVQWSADGKSLYYRNRNDRLVSRDLSSGQETEVGRAASDWSTFAVSPDGRAVAAVTTGDASGSTTVVVGPLQGERRPLLRLNAPASIVLPADFAWTLDGHALVVVEQPTQDRARREIWLVPVDGTPARRLDVNIDRWQIDNGFQLSPDGRQIAFVASAGERRQEIWALENFLPAGSRGK